MSSFLKKFFPSSCEEQDPNSSQSCGSEDVMEQLSVEQHRQDSICSYENTGQQTLINVQLKDNTIINSDININFGNESAHLSKPASKQCIDTIPQPVQHFCETEKYNGILESVKNELNLVLQCHGFPGTGKTEIVRQLARKFPYENEEASVFVKWHIQYRDKDEMHKEIEELIQQMKENNLLPHLRNLQEIFRDVKKNVAHSFVSALYTSDVPILLVIEDIQSNDLLIKDILRNIGERKSTHTAKLHVYFSTRKRSAVLSDEKERIIMPFYKMEEICGFNENESVKFLLDVDPVDDGEVDCAKRLFKRFSGSPLGLRVAKAYCCNSEIMFQEYLDLIESVADDVHQEEEEEVTKERYGENWLHVFQAIAMPFKEKYKQDDKAKLTWKVLSCLSYLDPVGIPRFLLNKCFQNLRGKDRKSSKLLNKRDSGKLMTTLVDYGMCTEQSKDQISCHEVVLHALRICQPEGFIPKFEQVQNVIWVLAGLVTKDFRSRENRQKMGKLFPHLRTLLIHLSNDKMTAICKENKEKDLLNLVISHLYETAGSITTSTREHRSLSNQYFEQAIKHICWSADPKYDLCSPSSWPDMHEISKYVVGRCECSGINLRAGFITEYESAVFTISDESTIKFWETRKQDKTKLSEAKKAIEEEDAPEVIINHLREAGLFLKEDVHRKVFFCERLASILHSWSRVIFYTEEDDIDDSLKSCSFIRSNLSHALSAKCRLDFGVPLLCEQLSWRTGKIPIVLRIKGDENALKDIQSLCEELLDPNLPRGDPIVYEHGLLKEALEPSHPILKFKMSRYLLTIFTRLLKSITEPESRARLIHRGNHCVKELFQLTKDNNKVCKTSAWLIHCAKYFAASNNPDEATKCFDEYFEREKIEKIPFESRSWAVFNFARATMFFKMFEKKEVAIEKVRNVLEQTDELLLISMKLKLEKLLQELYTLDGN